MEDKNKDGESHKGPPRLQVPDAAKAKSTKALKSMPGVTRVRTDSESPADVSDSDTYLWCPCGLYDRLIQKNNFEIECSVCKVWWHHKCVGFAGLTKAACMKMTEFRCPSCFRFSDAIAAKLAANAAEAFPAKKDQECRGEPTLMDLRNGLDELKGIMAARPSTTKVSERECSTLSVMMTDKLHGFSEIIRTTVKEECEKSGEKIQAAVVGTLKEKTASFADMVKKGNNDVMENTKIVVKEGNTESSSRTQEKMADDHWQREKRKKNVVIREVKELATDSVEKRKEHDMQFLTEVCNISGDDIDHAFRAGRLIKEGDPAPLRRNGKPRGPRPLICVLKSEEYVATYTNNGRGERVEVRSLDSEDEKKYYFINRDLCEADALADFRLRQLRKSKDQFQ